MALKAILDSTDGLSDDLKAHYTEKDGKFFLGVESVGGFGLENVEGLKTALGKERGIAAELKKKLEAFADIEPSKAKEALAKLEEMQNWTPEGKVKEQLEAAKKELAARAQADIEKVGKERDDYLGQLSQVLVDRAALESLGKAGAKYPQVLLPHLKSNLKMRRSDDGRFFVEVVDESGNPRIGGSDASAMTIDQLVAEFKGRPEFQANFNGTEQRGTGSDGGSSSSNNGGGGGGKTRYTRSDVAAGRVDIEKLASGEAVVVDD